ncbi:MAG TPA: type II toxin-antitoxin system VapC family toxin [Kofleriaceae bacterium]
MDTHVLVHYANSDRKLGRRARTEIDHALGHDELFVSALTFWEISMLIAKGRLALETTVAGLRAAALRQGIQEIPLDGEIAIAAGELPAVHGDPVDRMLVATALVRGIALMTADDTLLQWRLRGYRAHDASV